MWAAPEIKHLLDAANMGDLNARAQLAEYYEGHGKPEQAIYWLQNAAEHGHVASAAQFGVWLVLGHLAKREQRRGFEHLKFAAENEDIQSQLLVASLYAGGIGVESDLGESIRWLVRAARQGSASARRQLGFLLPGTAEARPQRISLLTSAAMRGDVMAQYFLGRVLLESDLTGDRSAALFWLDRAQAGGNARARQIVEQLLTAGATLPQHSPDADPALLDWDVVEHLATLPGDKISASPQTLREAPFIRTVSGFLDEALCDYMMMAAYPFLKPATVNDATRGMEVQDPTRSNSFMGFFLLEGDAITQSVNRRIAKITDTPCENGEALGVLHYFPGQKYDAHHDYFDPEFPVHQKEIKAHGQRVWTFLVYLNEEFEGGETLFDELDWKFKGLRGDAIWFRNVDSDGTINSKTLHTGLPPTSGEKWIISKWIRDRSQFS